MRFFKYITIVPLCFMIALIYSSYGMDNHEPDYTSSRTFKIPPLKKMVVLSLIAMSDVVSASPTPAPTNFWGSVQNPTHHPAFRAPGSTFAPTTEEFDYFCKVECMQNYNDYCTIALRDYRTDLETEMGKSCSKECFKKCRGHVSFLPRSDKNKLNALWGENLI